MRFVLLGLLLCLFCSSCQETEIKRRTAGYKGKAKSNPFLAAERYLNGLGFQASSEHGLGRLDHETATIFLPPSSLNTVGRSKRLLDWVEAGGHLVLMLEGGDMGGNDFVIQPGTSFWSEEPSDGVIYLLGELEVEYESKDASVSSAASSMDVDDWEAMEEEDRVLLESDESKIDLGDGEVTVHHWAQNSLSYSVEYRGDYGSEDDENDHRYLSLAYGSGRVSLLSDARPIRNRYLGYAEHAKFLANIVSLSRSGKVVFSSGDGDGFFTMLWRHFRMAVIGLLAVVAFWLWRHLPRYGPAQDITDGGTREFTEQIRGIGRFLWRHKRDDALLGAMRATVNRRLSVNPGISQEGIFEQLSEKTQLPVESVIEALTREQVTEPAVMIRVTQNLQKILKHIH